jgi:hypothetical protein
MLQRLDEEAFAFRQEDRETIDQDRLDDVVFQPVTLGVLEDAEPNIARDDVVRIAHMRAARGVRSMVHKLSIHPGPTRCPGDGINA